MNATQNRALWWLAQAPAGEEATWESMPDEQLEDLGLTEADRQRLQTPRPTLIQSGKPRRPHR